MTKAPHTVFLKVCPECGRTDRWNQLVPGHFHMGKKCPGIPAELTYRLDGAA